MEIRSGNYLLQFIDEPMYTAGSADNPRTYDQHYSFTREAGTTSQHGIVCLAEQGTRHSCIVMANGGATGIHEHSAVVVGDRCFIAVCDTLCCLSLPDLHLNWATKVDIATCFGVHFAEPFDCLISHGEIEIARVDFGGRIVWSTVGKDIFTGKLRLDGKHLLVTDFNDEVYRFEIASGKGEIITL